MPKFIQQTYTYSLWQTYSTSTINENCVFHIFCVYFTLYFFFYNNEMDDMKYDQNSYIFPLSTIVPLMFIYMYSNEMRFLINVSSFNHCSFMIQMRCDS